MKRGLNISSKMMRKVRTTYADGEIHRLRIIKKVVNRIDYF